MNIQELFIIHQEHLLNSVIRGRIQNAVLREATIKKRNMRDPGTYRDASKKCFCAIETLKGLAEVTNRTYMRRLDRALLKRFCDYLHTDYNMVVSDLEIAVQEGLGDVDKFVADVDKQYGSERDSSFDPPSDDNYLYEACKKIHEHFSRYAEMPIDTGKLILHTQSPFQKIDRRFINEYYAYYPSSNPIGDIHGGILKIYEVNGHLEVVFIMGITKESDMVCASISKYIATVPDDIPVMIDGYDLYIYHGIIELSDKSLIITLDNIRDSNIKMDRRIVMIDIADFMDANQLRSYYGGVGLLLENKLTIESKRVGLVLKDEFRLREETGKHFRRFNFQSSDKDKLLHHLSPLTCLNGVLRKEENDEWYRFIKSEENILSESDSD